MKGLKERRSTKNRTRIKKAGTRLPSEVQNIIFENVIPEINGGLFPVKCVVGETLCVETDIFKDGHEVLGAGLKHKKKSDGDWTRTPMKFIGNDRWAGTFTPRENTRYLYSLEAWVDLTATWLRNIEKKALAYPSVASDVLEGVELLQHAQHNAFKQDRETFLNYRNQLQDSEGNSVEVLRVLHDPNFHRILKKYPLTECRTSYPRNLELVADRKRAEFGTWYEIFPRSQGRNPNKSATFKDGIPRLKDIRQMGFDVLYLAPIHPIGTMHRKGPNNSLTAGFGSPGSPWAIGSPAGGHTAIHPELGTIEDFEEFVRAAEQEGLEIALDLAFQCSPDHPYVKEHPEWFYHLPDGSIRYAENPPKKYEDIYPLNFNCKEWQALWNELKRVVLFWIERGIKNFRVDNPHTKPLLFWKWLIDEIQRDHPETIFLAEAFTRPKIMKFLAKAGFTQSYTYFTWRNTKAELHEYFQQLAQTEMKYYFRANLFANTPDILPGHLQKGGRPAFKIRYVLAATLSSSCGIYSGFELCENRPKEPGSEEYLDSEKYQYKVWDWDRPGNIKNFIAKVNEIRIQNPALQEYKNLEFYDSSNEAILCYGKRTADNSNKIVVVVNLDPFHAQEDLVTLPLERFGIGEEQPYEMKDLLTGEKYPWKGPSNYVRLDPQAEPVHIFLVDPQRQ